MKQLRTRTLAFVLSLLMLPSLLLFSAPVAAAQSVSNQVTAVEGDVPTDCIVDGSVVTSLSKQLSEAAPAASADEGICELLGIIDLGNRSPVGLRLDLYKGSKLIESCVIEDSVLCGNLADEMGIWLAFPFSAVGVCPDSPMFVLTAPPEQEPNRTCLLYLTLLPGPGTYKIKATLGQKWGLQVGLSTVGAMQDGPIWGYPTVMAPTFGLTHTKGSTASTPAPPPPPPPPPVPPTLTVNTLPTQTDTTYLSVSGTATPGAAVRLDAGGHESSTYLVGEKGTFMLGTTLAAGENHLKVTATKDGGTTTFEATVTQAPKPDEPKAPAAPEVPVTTPVVPTPPTSVLPENAVSRAEFAQMMVRAFHLPDAGMLALELPNGPITRAEAALLAAKAFRLAGLEGTPAALSFTDTAAIPYPTDVALAVGVGLATGLADGSFRPSQNLTRAEATATVERAVTLMDH